MTQFWEIATIMSSKRVAVHLHEFPDDKKITPSFLYDKLGVEADVIFAELGAEDNIDLLTALYLDKFLEWEGIIRKPTATPSSDVFEPITMPPTIGSSVKERGVALDMLEDGAHFHNDAFEFWVLPRRDLVLPFDSSMRCQLFNLTLEQSEATKCVAPTPYAHPEGALQALREATTRLQGEVVARTARWNEQHRYVAALHRIDAVLRLQSRHWASRRHESGIGGKITLITTAREAVSAALDEVARFLDGNETTVATDAMGYLRDASIRTAAEQLAYDPTSLRSREATDISTALGDAAAALAQSGHVVDFAKEHVLPALKEGCSHPSYGLAQTIDATTDPDLHREIESGWESALQDIEAHLGPSQASPYAPLVTGAKLFKGGTTIVGSMLTPGTFLPLWDALHTAGVHGASMRMSGVLVRWLLSTGRSSSTNPAFVGAAGRVNYGRGWRPDPSWRVDLALEGGVMQPERDFPATRELERTRSEDAA